jgi:hypothetical protein
MQATFHSTGTVPRPRPHSFPVNPFLDDSGLDGSAREGNMVVD